MICKTPVEILCKILNSPSIECLPLTEDGSNRQYFRILARDSKTPSLVLMQVHGQDAVDLKSGSYSWINISHVLKQYGIFVPEIHHLLKEYDSILIEDFGDTTLDIKVLKSKDSEIQNHYKIAVQNIGKFLDIKANTPSSWSKRGFDYTLLHRELEFFRAQFLSSIPDFQNSKDSQCFTDEIESLSRHISKLPQYFAHRDYHSRNLMFLKNTLGVIDFQDARWGPASYDLCSLFLDPYVDLSLNMRKTILEDALQYFEKQNGSMVNDHVLNSWHAVGLQRMLKAIGSFAFLTRKGKRDYRVNIAPTLKILNHFLPTKTQWPYLVEDMIPRLMKLSHEKAA